MLKVVAFDFGGVLAEEGFANGLRAIAARNGLGGESFLETARELIYQRGSRRPLTRQSRVSLPLSLAVRAEQ